MKMGFAYLALVLAISPISTAFAETTTGTSITQVSAQPSPWTGVFKNETKQNIQTAKDLGGATSKNEIRLNYKLSPTEKIGMIAGFQYDLAKTNQSQSNIKTKGTDVALTYTKVASSILGSDSSILEGRLYLPTSEKAHDTHENFMVRGDFTFPYALNSSYAALAYFNPRYFFNSGVADKADMFSQAKLAYHLTKSLDMYGAADHIVMLDQKAASMNRTAETFGPEVGVDWTANRHFVFHVWAEQDRAIVNPTSFKARPQYAAFNTKETTYMVKTEIKY